MDKIPNFDGWGAVISHFYYDKVEIWHVQHLIFIRAPFCPILHCGQGSMQVIIKFTNFLV